MHMNTSNTIIKTAKYFESTHIRSHCSINIDITFVCFYHIIIIRSSFPGFTRLFRQFIILKLTFLLSSISLIFPI